MRASLAVILGGLVCGLGCGAADPPLPDGGAVDDALTVDARLDASADAAVGFGALSGDCGGITLADLTSTTSRLVQVSFDFPREYTAADQPLLTSGGMRLATTPNAGGSSELSELFAFEHLARCEGATLLKTETEIVYDTTSKKTDILVRLEGHNIGVSVVRMFQFPLPTPLSMEEATRRLTGKLQDIPLSTASVSEGDRWTKQFLPVLAFDAAAAATVIRAYDLLGADVKRDTVVVVITTDGADAFIYNE